jgi:PAS domain S-box-containing protein
MKIDKRYEKLKNIGAIEKVLKTLAALTNNTIILTNEKVEIQWVNAAFTKTTGFELEEIIGKVPGHFLQGPKTNKDTIALMSNSIKNKEPFNVEILNYNKLGKEYWLNIEAHPIFDELNNLTNYFAIEKDITKAKEDQINLEETLQNYEWKNWELSAALEQIEKEVYIRKKAEEKLIKSEKLLNETQKMAKIGAWEIDLIESHLFWTEEVYSIHELDNTHIPTLENEIDFYFENDKELISNAINEAINQKKSFDLNLRILTGKNNIKWVRAIGYPIIFEEKVISIRGTFQDITKEKSDQEELNLSRNQFKAILESTKSSIFAIDNSYKYTAFNENHKIGVKMLWGVDIFVGMDVREANLNNPDKITTLLHLERALNGEQFTVIEEFGEPSKYQKFFEIHFTPIIDKEKNIYGVSIFSTDITERIEFQDRIRKSEEQNKLITTNSPFGIFLTNKNGECTYTNERYQKISNLTYEENLGYGWVDSIYIYDKEKVVNGWNNAIINDNFSFNMEYRNYKDNEEIGWVVVKAVEIIHNDVVTGYLGFTEDITEIKIAQEELNRLTQLQAAIINNSSHAIITTDTEGTIQLFNPAAEKMLGYNSNELVYQTNPGIFHDMDQVVERAVQYSEELGISIVPGFEVFVAKTKMGLINEEEWTYISKNKRKFPVMLSINELRDIGSNITGFVGIAKDITKEKEALEELQRTYANIKSLIENTTDSIWSVDLSYNIVNINSIFANNFELAYNTKLVFGDNIIKWFNLKEKTKWIERYNKAFEGLRFSIEESLTLMDETFYTEITFNPVVNEHNDIIGCSVFLRDITERKGFQLQLEQSKEAAETANKSKSAFLANMSHEIRTPMNAILGFAELIQSTELDALQNDYAQGIANSGKSLLILINDILDLSKIEAGKLEIQKESISIIRLCNELKQIFSLKVQEKGLNFIVEEQNNIPSGMLLDETRIRQVLFNIIGNAVKFTSSGYIKMRVEFEENSKLENKINLRFLISDTGIGIPENQQNTIFEAFKQQDEQSTRKYGGTGLGLTITKRLVEMMDGKIELISKQGEGSTFIITLNNVELTNLEKTLDSKANTDVNLFKFKDSIILVAEDIQSNQMILSGYLRKHENLDIVFTENGLEVVAMAKQINPDLILMDIQMPEMDGFEATKILRSMQKLENVPIIALTAFAMTDEALKIDKIFDGYLTKPLSKKLLFEELNKHIGSKEEINSNNKEIASIDLSKSINEENKILFKNRFLERIIELSKTIEIDNLKELNDKIIVFSNETNEPLLQDISKDLKDSLESFNITKIIKLLKDLMNL